MVAPFENINSLMVTEQASKEIVDGFLLLMEFCPLLNNIDTQTQNNNIESLLKEMHEMKVISEEDKNKILEIRLVLVNSDIWVTNLLLDASIYKISSNISEFLQIFLSEFTFELFRNFCTNSLIKISKSTIYCLLDCIVLRS